MNRQAKQILTPWNATVKGLNLPNENIKQKRTYMSVDYHQQTTKSFEPKNHWECTLGEMNKQDMTKKKECLG